MKNINKAQTTPFLRWAGGKRWLAPKVAPLILDELSKTKGSYIEPFVGAGAMFFYIAPKKAILADINTELIETYKEVSRNWLALVDELKNWPVEKEFYYSVRSSQPTTRFLRACRFLYLNRNCYGGLYRENKSGFFNVPFGGGDRNHLSLWEKELLQDASNTLQSDLELTISDFEKVIKKAKKGDVIYCDPTYSTIKRKQFDRYGKTIFSWSDQMRLAISADQAMERGVVVIISNSGCFDLNDFYPRAYRISLNKTKTIGNKAKTKSIHQESLFILDPESRKKYWQQIGEIENRKKKTSFTSHFTKTDNSLLELSKKHK